MGSGLRAHRVHAAPVEPILKRVLTWRFEMDTPRATRAARGRGPAERGQGLVEFAMLVPFFLLLLLGMLEFGFAFDQNLTLEYATREGARVGSALANGGGALAAPPGNRPTRRPWTRRSWRRCGACSCRLARA